MINTDEVWGYVEARTDDYIQMADTIWSTPELNYQEFKSVAEHVRMLRAEGFRVEENVAGIPTAVMGEAGEGGPVIAFLGEYDALPGLSQEGGVPEQRPLSPQGNGHGCGHNLLGTGALLAAAAVKDYLAAHNLPGRVRYYGCPAEEIGAGKTFMVRDGAFDDVDIAITWHPADAWGVHAMVSLANQSIDFTFTGRPAHAAAAPHLGRSALDAVELMNVGVNYMREHMPSDARVHYAYLNAGGIAPNVVQPNAVVRYLVRALDLATMKSLVARVMKIAEGAALMTETAMRHQIVTGMSNCIANEPLSQAMHGNFVRLGPPPFDDNDRDLARKFQATVTPENIASNLRRYALPVPDVPPALSETVLPIESRDRRVGYGSTDVGDVSWVVPTVSARGVTQAIGTPGHSWQVTAQSKTPFAHKGMIHVAKAMASTAIDVFEDPDLLASAKADHAARVQGAYECPVPKDVPIPLDFADFS